MTATVPTREPEQGYRADSWTWTKSLPDYLPADGWTLSYDLTDGSTQITFSATDNGDGTHLVERTPAQTTSFTAGDWYWQAYVTSGSDKWTVDTGRIKVLEPYTGAYDARTDVQKVLDALDATILGKASSDQISYSIEGRSLSRMSPAELLEWRDRYQAMRDREIREERINKGLKSGNKLLARF